METTRIGGSPGRRKAPRIAAGRLAGGAKRADRPAEVRVFSTELVDADHRQRRQEMERALADVDRRAAALRSAPGEATVFAYKQSVRRLLELALAGSHVVERRVRLDPGGRKRLHVVVQEVDRAVDDLIREVLAGQRDALALAAQLDDIRGLLLDLVR